MWCDYVTFLSHDCDTYDTCDVTLFHTPSYVLSPKEKKRKVNINNNLAVLLSHDTLVSVYSYRAQMEVCLRPVD